MDKLLEMLGVAKLDADAQEKIKEKLDEIIKSKIDEAAETLAEVKAKELTEIALKAEKEKLIEDYEAKFEEYKEEITSKFSNFVDSIIDEEMVIPEKIVEYAKRGELYSDLIEQFKIRLSVDEGLLDDEVKGILAEAKEEILKLRGDLDDEVSDKLELQRDAQKLAAALYLREKSDGLTEAQKTHVFGILDGVTDRDEIDKKFDIIVESQDSTDDDDDEEDDDKTKKDISEGKVEVEDDEEDEVKGDESPFDEYLSGYVKTLQSNKIP